MTNISALDRWSTVHVGVGTLAAAVKVPFWLFAGSVVAYELLEYSAEHPRTSVIFGGKRPESMINHATDVGLSLLAYGVTRYFMTERKQ